MTDDSARDQRFRQAIEEALDALDSLQSRDVRSGPLEVQLHELLRKYKQLSEPADQQGTEQDTAAREQDVDAPTIPPGDTASESATLGSGVSVSARDHTTSQSFGDYELLEEIARGGMGIVYKARHTILNRVVALKMILAGNLASDEDVQRFHVEAAAAANLSHTGVVPIHEVGEIDGHCFFTMAFIDGPSLADKVAHGPLAPRDAAEVTKEIANIIACAHEQGVIHRDLKPANVLLDESGQPHVTDFGIAKQVQGDSNMTHSGQILGTPGYMPPEQAAGHIDEIRETADVYSLGAILYNLTTGRPPFQADNHLDTLMQVLEQDPVPPRQLNANIPKDLETICLKCLRKDQNRRYATAEELAEDLDCWLHDLPIKARPVGRIERGWRWCRRNPFAAGLWAALMVLMITVMVATVVISRTWNRYEVTVAQRNEQKRQTKVSREESVFLTNVVEHGNAIDNRLAAFERPLEDLLACITKTLAREPKTSGTLYYARDFDAENGPVPDDVFLSKTHGKRVSIEHGTVVGPGIIDAPEQLRRQLAVMKHDFRRVYKRAVVVGRDETETPPDDATLRMLLEQGSPEVAVGWMFYSGMNEIHYGYPGKGGYGIDYNPCERPFFEPFLEPPPTHGPVWGELYWDRQGLGLLLPCCTAIIDEKNEVQGIVGFDVRVESIRGMMTVDLPYFVKSYLLSYTWEIAVDSETTGDESDWELRPFPYADLVKKSKQRGSWLVRVDEEPPRYLAVFPLHITGCHYVVEADAARLERAALEAEGVRR